MAYHESFMLAVRIECAILNSTAKGVLEISEVPTHDALLFSVATPEASQGVGVLLDKSQVDDLRMVLYDYMNRLVDRARVKGATRGISVDIETP